MKEPAKTNRHDTREGWLRAASAELRPYFQSVGYPLPENIRYSIGFPSTGRRGSRVGECWHSSTSDDENFEIFIRADLADPTEVLGILVHELVHAALPIDAGHGKLYRAAALRVGLQGKMRTAGPGQLLGNRLAELAATLGPLPHARLNIEKGRENRGPADRPKKQGTRLLKAECPVKDCGYSVRVTSKWVVEAGPPGCPRHGPMVIAQSPVKDDTG
jgi:hypothetical protein